MDCYLASLHSSWKKTLLQSCTVQSLCALARSRRLCACAFINRGRFTARHFRIRASRRRRQSVRVLISILRIFLIRRRVHESLIQYYGQANDLSFQTVFVVYQKVFNVFTIFEAFNEFGYCRSLNIQLPTDFGM